MNLETRRVLPALSVVVGLDPAIHHKNNVCVEEMDAWVKPVHEVMGSDGER